MHRRKVGGIVGGLAGLLFSAQVANSVVGVSGPYLVEKVEPTPVVEHVDLRSPNFWKRAWTYHANDFDLSFERLGNNDDIYAVRLRMRVKPGDNYSSIAELISENTAFHVTWERVYFQNLHAGDPLHLKVGAEITFYGVKNHR
jgi:hypothetical protein